MRKQLGIRDSYKSDTRADQTPARRRVRQQIVLALKAGKPLGIRLQFKNEPELVADGSGDLLDAAICAVQAAWASRQAGYGIPADAPAGEGWIVSA